MAKRNSKGGCSAKMVKFLSIFAFVFLLFLAANSNNNNQTTPQVTNTPAPTATIAPATDYKSMPLEEAVQAIGQNTYNWHWEIRSCEVYPDVVYVDVAQNGAYYDTSSLLISAIRFSIDYMKEAFQLDGIPQLYFRFHENGRDKNGQQVDMTTITMRITKEKAAELDLDYFHEYAVTRQLAYLNAINGYSLHKDYKAVAK